MKRLVAWKSLGGLIAVAQLSAVIPAAAIAAAGAATVAVTNPATGVSPRSVVVDPTGKFAYVANSGSNNVSMYTIDATTGALTSIGLMAAGANPASVAVDPSGKFVYVANEDFFELSASNVSMYAIDPTTGALTSTGSPVAADFCAHSVTVDLFGKFAYVANWGCGDIAGSVSTYTINAASGALTPIRTIEAPCAPPPSPGSCAPWSVAVDPSGKFAYVANEGGFAPTSVSMYTIDATTGVLTSIGTIAAGGRAASVAVHPSGKFAYVADWSDPPGSAGNVSMYTINTTTGVLTSIGLIAAGRDPVSVTVDPKGMFVYVVNSTSNNVSMYTIDATTGVLTSIGTITAGSAPTSIAIHPSGKFAYVTNGGSNDVSMYNIDAATGGLTLIPASPPPPPPAPAALSITPQTADFGSAVVGGSADRSFTVINSGGSTASGTASTVAPFLVISGSAFVLGPGGSQTVVVRFSPTTAGAFGTNISFTWNGGSTSAVVTGTATSPPPPPPPPPEPPGQK